jgi:hypothetical protein
MRNCIFFLNIALISFLWAAVPVKSAPIPVENASFESPVVDPNAFQALPYIDGWIETDLDTFSSANTGVFPNTPTGSPDHIANADGNQLAFLGSQTGNALEQDLAAVYKSGCEYRLSVAIGISSLFPPSREEPTDTIELALYYCDPNDPNEHLDIVSKTIEAEGLSSTQLRDFSLYLPRINSSDTWAGKSIGIAIRATGQAGGFWDIDNVRLEESVPASLFIENASFESPFVDPNTSDTIPIVDSWTELDTDSTSSTNTGVFLNTPADSPNHITNIDGNQLAFLGFQEGNALKQNLKALYRLGADYRLTAGVAISAMSPPSAVEPVDNLELALYYYDGNEPTDIVHETIPATGKSSMVLEDVSIYLTTILSDDPWKDRPIGIAIRAAGQAGGFWDLDNVRLEEFYPVSLPVANASFELPEVDPEGYPASPVIEMWKELDLDVFASANTGVFLNTPVGSEDHMNNADGKQLVFLGSQKGNGLEQDLSVSYSIGSTYRLTVGVGTSMRFPPSMTEPVDYLELAFYYRDGNEPVDIVTECVPATGLSSRSLRDFSVYLPPVYANDPWAGKPIGIAMRSAGAAGGYWDLDNVRLGQSLPPENFILTNKE